jgi:C1A family cysteine protease
MSVKELKWRGCTIVGVILLVILASVLTMAVAQKPVLQEAPKISGPVEPPPIINGHGTGFIPPPLDLSHLTLQRRLLGFVDQDALPSSWDWRNYSKVTSVKDQGACGSCYAFAAIANIESEMLIDDAGIYDFSENNAKECNWEEVNNFRYLGKSWGGCSGGNYDMLVNLFSQDGTVLESCDPYVPNDKNDCEGACPYQKTLLGWKIISGNAVPDTTTLKDYIYASASPVYTTLYADSSQGFDGSYDGSYTFNYTTTSSNNNHAVLIVGWSDNLPPVLGETTPADGWIVKNSWGSSWGDDGYFYITYGSANIGKDSSFMYDWQDYDEEGDLMYYDEAGGWWNAWGYSSPDETIGWGLCKFIPTSNTYVTRVEFWTTDVTTDVDIYLYDDFDGTTLSNLLYSNLDLSFEEAGYHSVQLNSPLPVTTGNDIIVVVKFDNANYNWPLAADSRGPYQTGRTYISHTGATDSWYDLGANKQNDVAIRLRTTIPATITTCNATGANKTYFQPGERVYVKGSGLAANSSYKIWLQNTSVKAGDALIEEENPATAETPKNVSTNSTGAFGPTEIWAIPSGSFTHYDYDIVVDKQSEGGYTGKLNYASDGKTSNHVGMGGDVAPSTAGDGIVDIGDVILLHNHILYPENPRYKLSSDWAGDCQCDGETNIGDVILLHNHILYPENSRYNLNCCRSDR